MLLVIVITTVLLLLALPTTRHIAYVSRNTTCVSNLRSIGQAMAAYAGDHSGAFPSLEIANLPDEARKVMGTAGNDRLLMALYSYLGNPRIYRCPVVMAETSAPYLQNGSYNSTYNQNVYSFAVPMASLQVTSQTILVYEGLPQMNISGTPPHHVMEADPVSSVFGYHNTRRSGVKGMNALMADGHVEPNLYYIGWGDPDNTLPADGGIWGASRWSFNL